MPRTFFRAVLVLASALAAACSALTAGPSGPTYRIAISGTT